MRSIVLKTLVSLYRGLISPVIHWIAGPGFGCRFVPTCSQYAEEAIAQQGWVRGGALAVRRVCRCHPWTPGGYDPVPEPERSP